MNLPIADALYQQGIALLQSGQPAPAADLFRQALANDMYFPEAYNALGLAVTALGRSESAIQAYDMAIRLAPTFAAAHINRGIALRNIGQLPEALESLDQAVALAPENANAHGNRGSILAELKRQEDAVIAFDRCLQLNPDQRLLWGLRLINKTYICDWTNLDAEIADLATRIDRNPSSSPPWPLLPLLDRPDLQRKSAEAWAAVEAPENPALGPLPPYAKHDRIRIGYYSADFWRHATAYLIAELFERHDRTKFELIAFSFGANTGDDMQRRLMAGCDRFVDVRARGPAEIAALSRSLEIDIAVDLKGLTTGHRIGIFAHRAAPIQVNYLGYPGTMGVPYMDYIIADATIIPSHAHAHYVENVVTLPHSYQVSDTRRTVSPRPYTREMLRLPPKGFVFCCFNNNYKVMPAVFDTWMRILKAVDGSVLWLISDNQAAEDNLRKEAVARGIDPERLVFAARVATEEHLARQKVADLLLDTLPCNAHTTANDALWMGVPVLTCMGEGLVARVAGSLLKAMDLGELIAPNLQEYESTAIALGTSPERFAAIKEKLARNRQGSPLFDTQRYARNIEAAYTRMVDIHRAGQPPTAFAVEE